MAVPDFQSIMLPLLGLMGDGAEHALAEAIETLGDRLGLSAEEKKELLPSESDVKFDNRVRWAAFYLRKAGLLERTGRGKIRISERGHEVLKTNPGRNGLQAIDSRTESQAIPVHLSQNLSSG